MKRKKRKIRSLESVKLDSTIIELVRDNKEETGVSIGVFIEKAIVEKLNRKSQVS